MTHIRLTLLLLTFTLIAHSQQLYICGDSLIARGWGFDDAHQMPFNLADDGYTNTLSLDVIASPFFCISNGGGKSWPDYNQNNRYSCARFNSTINDTYRFGKRGDYSHNLAPGHYDISIDARTMELTLKYIPAPAPKEISYCAVGDPTIGLSWNPIAKEITMSEKSNMVYELKRHNIKVEKAKKYLWRVLENGGTYGWSADQYGAHGYNQNGEDNGYDNVEISFDESGTYDITFTIDLNEGALSIPKISATKINDNIKYKHLYINDKTGWKNTRLYAWGNAGKFLGEWEDALEVVPETVEIDGVKYLHYQFLPLEQKCNLTFTDGGSQEAGKSVIISDLIINKDYFITVTPYEAKIEK